MAEEDNFIWYLPKSLRINCYSCGTKTKPALRRNLWVEGELSKIGKILTDLFNVTINKDSDVRFVCYNCFRSLSSLHANYVKKLNKIKDEKVKLKPFLKRKNKYRSNKKGNSDKKRKRAKRDVVGNDHSQHIQVS